MTPLEYELRWERVWNYLMLDCITLLKDDLCIPGDVDHWQKALRGTFDDHYRTNEFNLASGLLMLRMTAQLRSFLNEPDVVLLLAWGDYLSDLVNFRVGEFVWGVTLNGLEEVQHPEWLLAPRFISMQSQRAYRAEQFDAKLKTLQFTAVDRTIRERLSLSQEDLLTHLELISYYNIFARVWHESMGNVTLGELDEVYAYFKALAMARGVCETRIPYPGIWETGPQRTLLGITR